MRKNALVTRVGIIGGGPGGYEAALVAAQLGAEVSLVDSGGLGGSCVLTDCVPSKTLIATAELMTRLRGAQTLGVELPGPATVDLAAVNKRVKDLASAQSVDIAERLRAEGVRLFHGHGRLATGDRIEVHSGVDAGAEFIADVALIATGASPRTLPDAVPDGERILTWEQLYELSDLPEHLIVVGSGVTGAEFASAYHALGSRVTLVSSRQRVLPGEDADAAAVLEEVFATRGMQVLGLSRAQSVRRDGDSVHVQLTDGTVIEGTHCLLAVGSTPNTKDLGLEACGIATDEGGFVRVDKVSRTSARGVYAAGDCTGVLMLASVAAMQGRIAMWHALGDAVAPLDPALVSSTVFTDPEIATVGATQEDIDSGRVDGRALTLPLATNARAKMQVLGHGFVKIFCRPSTGIVIGGVVVAPSASELIYPIAMAVEERLTVDDLTHSFTVYPSLSGSIAEAARQLHTRG
jgi:dihydrolipoamide dehydrogenase